MGGLIVQLRGLISSPKGAIERWSYTGLALVMGVA